MLLLIDAGNTRIKWALVDDGAALGVWRASGAVSHAELNHLPASWQPFAVTRAIVANVAGAKLRDQLQLMIPTTAISWFSSEAQLCGLRSAYRNPRQLGCDRFAAALGARALEPGKALIVATCGTATTIDAISADGVFLGGMILPGLGLMASSLATRPSCRRSPPVPCCRPALPTIRTMPSCPAACRPRPARSNARTPCMAPPCVLSPAARRAMSRPLFCPRLPTGSSIISC